MHVQPDVVPPGDGVVSVMNRVVAPPLSSHPTQEPSSRRGRGVVRQGAMLSDRHPQGQAQVEQNIAATSGLTLFRFDTSNHFKERIEVKEASLEKDTGCSARCGFFGQRRHAAPDAVNREEEAVSITSSSSPPASGALGSVAGPTRCAPGEKNRAAGL